MQVLFYSIQLVVSQKTFRQSTKKELADFNNYWPRLRHFPPILPDFIFYDLEMAFYDLEFSVSIFPNCSSHQKTFIQIGLFVLVCDKKCKLRMDPSNKTQVPRPEHGSIQS